MASYNDERQNFFETYMSPRNKKYCDIHGFNYLEFKGKLEKFRDNYTWLKFTLVRDLINDGTLKDGDILTHLDADMCIVKLDKSYETKKSFTYCIDSGNTHCMGSYSLKINDWTKNMIDLILSDSRYEIFKNKITVHEAFGRYSCFWDEFREQASWYSLAGIKRHSWEPFWNLPNNGFHTAKDEYTVYSLEELNEHVDILPTEWNVTELDGETPPTFNINKVKPEDVVIRHFSGGQVWNAKWFLKHESQ